MAVRMQAHHDTAAESETKALSEVHAIRPTRCRRTASNAGPKQRFDCWAIVEAMGFKKYAGHVTTQELAGSSFIRVDVPETSIPPFAKLIGAGSIYMITPTDEATARKAAAVLASSESPLPVYIPREQKQLPAASPPNRDWNDVDEDDYLHEEELAEQLNQNAIDEEIMAEGDAAQAAEQAANQ
jgi:hypothetical protein